VVLNLYVLALVPVILAPARAAEIAVKGKVEDETNAPVAGAHIRLSASSPDIRADTSGAFDFHLPAAGEYRIAAWRDGFFALENYPVEISPGRELLIVLNHKREIIESVKVTATPDSLAELDRNYAAHSLSGTDILDVPSGCVVEGEKSGFCRA
jgi:Carboxypeptidase regulatory-like domain